MSSRNIALISILTFAINHVRGDCYTRDGTAAKASRYYTGPELVACGRGSNTCCLAGQKCGSNLLCSEGPTLSREYCANKDWEGCSALGAGNSAPYTQATIRSDTLDTEILPYGITLNECSENSVCYNSTSCCDDTSGTPIYYINPKTGDVKEAKGEKNIDTASAVYWNASESVTSSASPASSTPASQSTATPPAFSPSSSPSGTSNPNGSQKSSGLSSGAAAGIGVGCVIAAAGLFTLAWFFLRRRRNPSAAQMHTNAPTEYQYQDVKPGSRTGIYQLQNDEPPRELSGNSRRVHEMP